MSLTQQANPEPASSPRVADSTIHCNGINGDPVPLNVIIRQDPLSVTLDGPAILALSLSLILSSHLFHPRTISLLVGSAAAALFIRNDYQNYLNLGPGGIPSTFPNYLRISWLKLWALRDPLSPPGLDRTTQPRRGILRAHALPQRAGPRPRVVGIVPQRQIDQRGSETWHLALRGALSRHAEAHESELRTGTSCFEKHGLGLFARRPARDTCRGEICHVHDSDRSLHLSLHPDDAREVLAKGWGERHPLTGRAPVPFKIPVPREFTMVYAPRSLDELEVVCRIVEAAEYWVTGRESRIDLAGEGAGS
ncbi:hypothetical protein F4810DRAFT_213426 [Camillea tinctor]|nr:hypothetical protein F4810DRAFT_213426 [Camillea tinctor]